MNRISLQIRDGIFGAETDGVSNGKSGVVGGVASKGCVCGLWGGGLVGCRYGSCVGAWGFG